MGDKRMDVLEERIKQAGGAIDHIERKIIDLENRKKNVIVFNVSRLPNEFVKVLFEVMEEGSEIIVSPQMKDIEVHKVKKDKK